MALSDQDSNNVDETVSRAVMMVRLDLLPEEQFYPSKGVGGFSYFLSLVMRCTPKIS